MDRVYSMHGRNMYENLNGREQLGDLSMYWRKILE
jgi:hypothetical protein